MKDHWTSAEAISDAAVTLACAAHREFITGNQGLAAKMMDAADAISRLLPLASAVWADEAKRQSPPTR